MGQGNCKETIRHRIKRVLADGLPGCRGCLFETTKTDGWKASGSRLALVPAAGTRPAAQRLGRFLRATQPIGTLYWQKALGHAAAWLKNGNFDWLSSLWRRSLRMDAVDLARSTSPADRWASVMSRDREVRLRRGCLFDAFDLAIETAGAP
jgi:hypothetical protein